MADIIQLLPDSIANQIAAGEVVQRPSSVVKELVENAIDAGSSKINLIIKDAGKTLIQIIDDGCGMSETDARMSFERHATSKVRKSKDLFEIRTMGFRGEALASIAAIAQVEMKSKRRSDEMGTKIIIEDSSVKSQEPCQTAAGTSISVKNLFYNVPARRKFLKSNAVEMRHIIDEFQRLAIAHPDLHFTLHHNNTEVYHLPPGKLRQRLVGIFGDKTNQKLVPVKEETDALGLQGFIGKPTFAKKTRGEQLFFVNNRFIKSSYLNHAIMGAYEDLLTKDSYPFYVIFLEIDPARIDINVHPTKQEIKFEDEKLIYNYLKVAVRHALGQYNITPTLNFNQENSFSTASPKDEVSIEQNFRKATSASNSIGPSHRAKPNSELDKNNLKHWQKLYDGLDEFDNNDSDNSKESKVIPPENSMTIKSKWGDSEELDDEAGSFSRQRKEPYQIHSRYIMTQIKSGFILIDQNAAHERILYEKFLGVLDQKNISSQKELFPKTINIEKADIEIMRDILPEINKLGFDIQESSKDVFVLNGMPSDLRTEQTEQDIIELLLEQYKNNVELNLGIKDNIARSMARSSAIKVGQKLTNNEMQELIDHLFACSNPTKSPSGHNCIVTFELNELQRRFTNI